MTPPSNETGVYTTSVRRPLVMGLAVLMTLVLGLGAWAGVARISGAVIARGEVRVEEATRIVSHELGGIVVALNVQDGDVVAAADTLLVLEDTVLRAKLDGVEDQLFETLAASARWRALAFSAPEMIIEAELKSTMAAFPSLARRVERHQAQLEVTRRALRRNIAQQTQIMAQIREEIAGDETLIESQFMQLEILEREIERVQTMITRGLGTSTNLFALERDRARLTGEVGVAEAAIASKKQRLIELQAVIESLEETSRLEALEKLSELEASRSRLAVERAELRVQLDKLVIQAPINGRVYDSRISGPGALVVANLPVLSIVPDTDAVIAVVRVSSNDIEQVFVGQEAVLQFQAYSARSMPVLTGAVRRIAPDTSPDPVTKRPVYGVMIEIPRKALALHEDVDLVNGMPVSAFLATTEQTPLEYVLRPISRFLTLALRDT